MKVPSIVVGVDVRRLQLRSVDVLVVGRIDGTSTIEELADVLGMSEDEVDSAVGRLDMLGVIEWTERNPTPRSQNIASRAHAHARAQDRPAPAAQPHPPAPPERVATKAAAGPVTPSQPAPRPPPGQAVAKDPFEDIDLDPERRARIDFLTSKLEGIDHYTLLGLGSDADKNDVRNAYFGLSKQFHPDTAYGRRLGPYKARMELIFNRLTEAYDVLSKSKRRADYDTALKRAGHFPVIAPEIPPAGAVVPHVARETKSRPPPPMSVALDDAKHNNVAAHATVEQAAHRAPLETAPTVPRAPIHATPTHPSVTAVSGEEALPSLPLDAVPTRPRAPIATAPTVPRAPAIDPPRTPAPAASAAEPTRAHSAPDPARAQTPKPPEPRSQGSMAGHTPQAADARPAESPPRPAPRPQGPASHTLRNLASSLKAAGQVTGTGDRVQRYLRDARAAEAENDFSQALNCLKLARQLAPDRSDLATEYERVYRVFVTTHADDLRRRALSDEKAGRLADATQAWLRVCDGRPNDLEAHYAAGRASLASKTELARTRGYLQRAVAVAPHASEGRILLARLYLANGQRAEAVREAEAAAKLYPDDQMLKNLIRELKA